MITVTLDKPATASSTQGLFLPEYAVDGSITNDDSRWCPGSYNPTRQLDIEPGARQSANTSVAVATTFAQRVTEPWVFGTPHTGTANVPPVAHWRGSSPSL